MELLDQLLDTLLNFNIKAFASIVFIDLVMSGDNAIIIGMAAAGLPPELRRKAIVIGIIVATVLRIAFAGITYQLLSIIGLTLAGGLLLLWVAFQMWREIRAGNLSAEEAEAESLEGSGGKPTGKTMRSAVTAIIVADVTMSLDNVLAVAGAAHDAPGMLVFGLVLSILLMAFAANFVARLLEKHKWLAYLGLVIVAYVALEMIWRGGNQVLAATTGG